METTKSKHFLTVSELCSTVIAFYVVFMSSLLQATDFEIAWKNKPEVSPFMTS